MIGQRERTIREKEKEERLYRSRENCAWDIPICNYLANHRRFVTHGSIRDVYKKRV